MTVVLAPPTQNDTRSSFADWMELQSLNSSRGRATKGSLTNVLDIAEDEAAEMEQVDEETGETLDEAILEGSRNQIIDATFEELEYRQSSLGQSYPFTVDSKRLTLDCVEEGTSTHTGRVVYLFCLLASMIRERKLQPQEALSAAEKKLPNVFQVCACLAAGGYLNGQVSSFGFPRATGDGFLPALRAAFSRFGIGRVRSEFPDGFPMKLKDGGIDVIAWRDHPDGMPGKLFLLGQCASGRNWKEKSILEYIGQFKLWFSESPAEFSVPAMFIPFTFHRDIGEIHSGPYLDAVKTRHWFDEPRFGIIFDRLRIALYAGYCGDFSEELRQEIDGMDLLEEVRSWVVDALRVAVGQEAA